jgi:hypothetical protein
MDALQRQLGYAYGYDDMAFLIGAEIDCEPIFFEYQGKLWMIELWKGQYGLETGSEIGVYRRSLKDSPFYYALLDATVGRRPGDPDKSPSKFFDCAGDNELLEMSFTLHRSGQKLFSRGPEKHWWLTGFKWGELSRPEDLSMEVAITFLDVGMCHAFVTGLTQVGHRPTQVQGPTVRFPFQQPRTHQPRLEPGRQSQFAQVRRSNGDLVATYNRLKSQLYLPNNDPNRITGEAERKVIDYINQFGPAFFVQAVGTLFRQQNKPAAELLNTLEQGFRIARDQAAQAVTNAGYTFSEWIGSVESLVRAMGLAFDFSCSVQIENFGPTEHSVRTELKREDYAALSGEYVVHPPEKIPPGGIGRFWIRPDMNGAAGWVNYSSKTASGDPLPIQHFEFGCPTFDRDNFARAQPTGYSPWMKSGTMTNWARDVKRGHPLAVAFVIGNQALPRGGN